jgi:hypothetical protein
MFYGQHGYECCGCRLVDQYTQVSFETPREAIEHLKEHLRAGHAVPDRAFERLWEEEREDAASN